ncbi:MAG: MaoC family dehydratase [Dehalococcoidia bacterium]|nr:MaoC family dehydratase [Dehalococcoidia bacterium]
MATFEEIQLGQSASFTKTLSETDIYLFAGITGDMNPAHVDAVSAANGMFKQRIAHGMLTASFISTVIAMQLPGPGTIYAGQDLQFRAPVFIGDTVTARVEVSEKLDQRKWVKLKTEVTNQDGKVVVTGVATVIPPAG